MIPCFPRHARRIRLEWRTVRSIVKRILVTCAATTALALLLTMVLCALGNAMAPKWQVEPFTDHITLTTTNTAIQAVDPATGAVLKTPQEGAYRTKETHITVALDGGKTVNAIVREPLDAPADRPACLFLHGSGTGKSSEAFGDVANAMASAGITTLVPDKRLDNYTMLHRDYVSSAHDYAKSLEILRKWPGVSRSETGIYAESEGTWIATVLTQQHPDLAFAILTSPPVVSGRQQMTLAATNYLTAAGAPDAVKQLIPRITSLGTQRMGLAYADFDAAKYRRSLTMPLLINYGVKDTAMPVEQGARLLIKAANQAGNTNVTLRYYDANHQLRTGSNQTVPGLPLEPHLHARSGGLDQRGDERHGCERLGNADDRRNAAESDGRGTAEDPARAGEVDGCDCRRNRGLPALRAAGDVRRANSAHRRLGARAPCVTAGIARFGFDGTGGANGFDFNVFNGCDHTDRSVHTTECGTSNRNNRPSIPGRHARRTGAQHPPCRRHDRRVPGVSGHRHH